MTKQYKNYSLELDKIVGMSENIVIITHVNPDGDAIGSVTSMYHYLKGRGKEPIIIIPNKYPSFLSFLDKDSVIKVYNVDKVKCNRYIEGADLIIALDFNTSARVDAAESSFLQSKAYKVLIDHHLNPQREIFNLLISDIEVSSTCELIFWLLMSSDNINRDCRNITLECAESLWTGMITDTNSFSNSLFSSTFEMALHLTERGVDVDKIRQYLFGEYSESRVKLMGKAIFENMKIDQNLRGGYIILSLKDLENFDYMPGDTEGFVNIPLSIAGVDISALFFESDGFIRVSFRSRNGFSANEFSSLYFNGGGHDMAAGGRLYMPIDQVEDFFISSLTKYIEEKKKA